MTQPLVSVVIPAYNGAKTLEKCLDSVLAQQYEAIEVIVVNDGSTDGTRELLDRYARIDSRVCPIHQEHSGVAAARNSALLHCRGEYIQFVDCDDSLPPDSTGEMAARAQADGSEMVIGAFNMVIESYREPKDLARRSDALALEEYLGLLCKAPNSFYYGVLWNKLFRRELIEAQQLRFSGALKWGEDFHFVTRYLVGVNRVSFTRKIVYDYVRNPKGITFTVNWWIIAHLPRSIALKRILYASYKELYRKRGVFDRYRRDIRKYMISFTITD